MPRDGSSVYTQPFPNVVADTAIESAVYNGFTNDIAQDLNLPRPIVAGGTGATSAAAAIVNLGGEKAKQGPVTNYSSFPFVTGSFYSNAAATGAPNPTNGFAGIYYEMADLNYAAMEARDMATGILYVRNKIAGVWGAWAAQAGSTASLDTAYVNVGGDTMTGQLSVNANIASATTATAGAYHFGNSGTKSLAYDGANFYLAGGALNTGYHIAAAPTASFSLTLNNSTANLNKNFRVSAAGALEIVNHANTTTVGTLSDVGNFGVPGTITAGSDLRATNTSYSSGAFGYKIDSFVGSGTVPAPYVCNVMNANPNFGATTMETVHISGVWAGWQLSITPNVFQFRNDGSAQKSGAGTAWVVISDVRAKDIKGEYTHGLAEIDELRPVRFAYKQTPGIEAVGLIAQEVEKSMPEMIMKEPRHIDGQKIDDCRSADYTALTFALVNAVKELKARVEELEAR